MNENDIKILLVQIIFEISNKKILNYDKYLLGRDIGIPREDFLYFIVKLEDYYHLPIIKVLEKHDYTVFTINNLAESLTNTEV